MKAKLKEALVNLALDAERCRKFKKNSLIITAVLACMILLFHIPRMLALTFVFACVALIIFLKCLEAIKENEVILDRNKLINIILSKEDIWFYFFLYFIAYPLLLIINLKMDFIIFLVIAIGLGLLGTFLSKKVSKYFDNKLKKIEYWR